jgi:hypothetical protein
MRMRFRKILLLLFLCNALITLAQTAPKKSSASPQKSTPLQSKTLSWQFPLLRTHAGILIGNGTQGLMIWGSGRTLNITVGRAGFWDHRGGNEFSARTTFTEVKQRLQAKDEAGIKKLFDLPKTGDQGLGRPQQIGGGRLEITLPEGWKLKRGDLNLHTASLKLLAADPAGKEVALGVNQAITQELAWVELPAGLAGKVAVTLIPSWEYVKDELQKVGVAAPAIWT